MVSDFHLVLPTAKAINAGANFPNGTFQSIKTATERMKLMGFNLAAKFIANIGYLVLKTAYFGPRSLHTYLVMYIATASPKARQRAKFAIRARVMGHTSTG